MAAVPLASWQWAADGVAVVTLNSPPMNLVGRPMLAALTTCFDELASGPARAVVVTGAGERAFSAGADIKEFPAFAAEAAAGGGVAEAGQRAFDRLANLAVPTIAAIEGFALGGGCELALACDIRIAGTGARLGLPETGLGLFPCYGGTQRLARLIGPALAKELIFSGRLIEAAEAERLGLINRLTAAGGAQAAALELATTIAGRAGQAIRAAKALIDSGLEVSLAAGQAQEARLADTIFASADAQEGVAAFIAKRPPRFSHL